jgi:NPCBM/NEW2 domain-containing protein/uncharacterized protein DUF4380
MNKICLLLAVAGVAFYAASCRLATQTFENEISLGDLPWTIAKNKTPVCQNLSICGKTISIAGKNFSNGLGVNSRSKVIYRLNGECKKFECFIGCDDTRKGNRGGNVVFKIFCDGIEKFNSGIIKPKMPPRFVQLSLDNVKQLELAVEEGDDGTFNDNADWADAIVHVLDKKKLFDATTEARMHAEQETVKYKKNNYPPGKKRGSLKTEKINYKGWKNSYKLSNGIVELVVVPSLSGRIMHFSYLDGENIIYSNPKEYGKQYDIIHGKRYLMYGGHVSWLGPAIRCWPPDAFMVAGRCSVTIPGPGKIKLVGLKSFETGIRYSREIEMSPDNPQIKIIQTMENVTDFPVEWNIWNNTRVNAKGCVVWFPVPKNSRYYGRVKCPPAMLESGQASISGDVFTIKSGKLKGKIFSDSNAGWIACSTKGIDFIKNFGYFPEEKYSKEDGIVEIYLDPMFIELENHSSLKKLNPGEKYSYTEEWILKKKNTGR